jgi:hypothetical protein
VDGARSPRLKVVSNSILVVSATVQLLAHSFLTELRLDCFLQLPLA